MRVGSRPSPRSAAATSSTLYLAKKAGDSPLTRMFSACSCSYSAANLSNSASSMVDRPRDRMATMPARIRKRIDRAVGRDLVHDEKRPPLGLHVHAAEILAEDAEDEELGAAQDENDRGEAGPALDDPAERPGEERVDQHGGAQRPEREAEMRGEAKRHDRKAGHRIQREEYHLLQRIVRFAGEARISLVGKSDLLQADPADHAPDEAV